MGGGLIGGAAMAVGLKGAAAAKPQTTGGFTMTPLEGVLEETGAAVSGDLVPTNFFSQDGQLALAGQLVDSVTGDVIDSFTALAEITQAQCDILNLVLGPLELDILGLVIEIPEPIILNIFAEPGPGNLLGNLLCAVAGLLDRGGPLSGLLGLLNNILRSLGLG
jgi:hypothetical protein